MIKQYFTFVNTVIGPYQYNPKYAFDNVFEWIPIQYEHICGIQWDSRNLWVWIYEWDIPEIEIKNIVSERLQLYWYHEKTFDKAVLIAISQWVENIY